MTVPNAASGRVKPANGWPLVIFQHGITRNRTDGLAISATLASQGFAMVSSDPPLHGITPLDMSLAPFRVNHHPFFPHYAGGPHFHAHSALPLAVAPGTLHS